jgi:hypothetical protein
MAKHNFNLSRIQLQTMLNKSEKDGMEVGLKWAMIFALHHMHSKNGWGRKRLQRLIDGVEDWADAINKNVTSGQKMQKWCEDMGLNFKK